jgi:hypothetical protein
MGNKIILINDEIIASKYSESFWLYYWKEIRQIYIRKYIVISSCHTLVCFYKKIWLIDGKIKFNLNF